MTYARVINPGQAVSVFLSPPLSNNASDSLPLCPVTARHPGLRPVAPSSAHPQPPDQCHGHQQHTVIKSRPAKVRKIVYLRKTAPICSANGVPLAPDWFAITNPEKDGQ